MPHVRQTSFVGGEVAPDFYGRTDLEVHGAGCRTLRNFFVGRAGQAISRNGTEQVAQLKAGTTTARLIPFVYSDSQAYVLEFGHQYLRVRYAGETAVLIEVATPYAQTDLAELKWAQSGDLVTLVHRNYAPRELRRNTHTDWTLTVLSFAARPAYFPENDPALVDPVPAGDATHPAREWVYMVTTVGEDADGTVWESAPFRVTQQVTIGSGSIPPPRSYATAPAEFAVYPDLPVELYWHQYGLAAAPGYRVLAWRVYRGRGNLHGYVGETQTMRFKDLGEEPDYTRTPPQGRNPLEVRTSSTSFPDSGTTLVRTENPRTVCYFERRLVFGGTPERPAHLFFSRTDDFRNFDRPQVTTDDAAVEFELASRRREEVRSLVGLERLLVITNASAWAGGGAGTDPLTATSVSMRVQEEVGASWVDPLVLGGTVLYARVKGAGVRALAYQEGSGGYVGADVSFLSAHLFAGHHVVDWAYAEDPHGLVWAVRDDGKLLCLTYLPEQRVVAWTRHDTDGVVKAICTVPEGDEDAVYLVVERTAEGATRRYIERMAAKRMDGTPMPALDCSAQGLDAVTFAFGIHPEWAGKQVWATVEGEVYGPFTVTSAGAVTLTGVPNDAGLVTVGLPFLPQLETLDMAQGDTRTRTKIVEQVGFEVLNSRGLYVGETFADMSAWQQRDVAHGYGPVPLETRVAEVPVNGTWNLYGRACLEQREPLPVTVLGVVRRVSLGGD